MNWTIWRLHRNQVFFAAGSLAAIMVFLLVTGIHLTGVYHQALATCGLTHTCRDLANELFQGDNWLWDLAMLAIVVPALFGIFWGVPLVAREVEEATHKLAWTQSVPRRRWLGANLGWILFAAAAWGAGFAALLTWWLGPENGLKLERFQPVHFDIQGIVPVAYAVFAVALGIAAGAWFRRVLPAAAATLGGFVLVRFVIQHFARPHYLHPVTSGLPLNGEVGVSGPSAGSWILSHGVIVDAAGRPLALPPTLKELPAACRGTFPGGGRNLFDCLSNHGYRVIATYQPAGRFWTFQAIESAIFIVLAGILVALASWRVLTADA
jgi:hypothetical protein